ncbi:MAG: tyrosine-type recombinase/integrase [Deltaproteobacteria bacterium]|nr:tyrosine-type recombinase/integrase [Deltaproteobacteria bacterium]
MPRLYQDKTWGTWYIEVERGKCRSLRTKNKAEALARFNKIKRRWAEGKLAHLTGTCTKTLGDYAAEFEAWSEINQPAATCRANLLALKKLREVAGDAIKLDRLGLKHLDQMITACRKPTKQRPRGLSESSINNYIRHARAALNKAVEWGYIQVNPLAKAKEIRTESRTPAFLPGRAAVTAFLAKIEDLDVRRLAAAYLATGRRRRELLALTWENVDLAGGRYLVRRSKTHLSKWYPLNRAFRAVLDSLGPGKGRIFGRWQHPDTVSKVIKRALVEAGYGHLRLHDLRHTFGVQVLEAGGTLKDLQELFGHTEARTTEIYAHLTDERIAEVADRVSLGVVDLGLGKRKK